MHRRLILAAVVTSTAFPPGLAWAKLPTKFDRRLLGVWRSDKERTLTTWKFKDSTSPSDRERIGKWFGKLTHRYTETTSYTEFEGETFSNRYWVTESGENFVSTAWIEEGNVVRNRVFLEGSQYIFQLFGKNIEYFKRIEA